MVAAVTTSARAAVIFSDIIYWLPGGVSVINPAVPPLTALVKILGEP